MWKNVAITPSPPEYEWPHGTQVSKRVSLTQLYRSSFRPSMLEGVVRVRYQCSQPLHVPALVPPLAFVESVSLPIMLSGGLRWLADWGGGSCCLGWVGCVGPERYPAGSLPSGLRSSPRHIGETSYIGISV